MALIFIVPVLMGQVAVAMSCYRALVGWFGDGDFLRWHSGWVMALFTVTVFIVEDFTRFFVHYCYHKIPLLWRFHAIHHSAITMTPLTLYRVHFIEYFINACRSLFVTGAISGLFMYCFVGAIGVYEVLGVSILNMLFNLAGANLRHSHIWIGFGRFEQVFISPAQHQIHHSSAKAHLDKNFGASLAIWDKWFGSWLPSQTEQVKRFGLYKTVNPQKLYKQILGIKTNR
jgi:sterol desaturase/sphingolipid hydroxylase (fatty acid hydroxylase superfamily)